MTNGFLLIDKESGITSSRVVQIIKKKFNFKKVGHLGTLDPMAKGLLILAVNRATKFSSLLLQSKKSYQAEVTLGQQTCLLYTSPSPRDGLLSRMPSSA